MKQLLLGVLIGSALTTVTVGAGDYLGIGGSYLHPHNETQAILNEIRVREALETIQMQRQNYENNHNHWGRCIANWLTDENSMKGVCDGINRIAV
jgi:hypothetical protein